MATKTAPTGSNKKSNATSGKADKGATEKTTKAKAAPAAEAEEDPSPYIYIPIEAIRVKPRTAPDANNREDFGDLEALAASIKAANNGEIAGIKQPIRVKPDGKGRYWLIDGERRYKAALLAQGSKKDYYLPAIEVEADYAEQDSLLDQLILNNGGKPLNLLEEGHVYAKLQGEPYSLKPADIARKVGKSATHIGNCLYLVENATPALKKQINEGFISSTAAVELLKAGAKGDDIAQATKKAVDKKTEKKAASKSAKGGAKAEPAKKSVSKKAVAEKLEKPVAAKKPATPEPAAKPAAQGGYSYAELVALKKKLEDKIKEDDRDDSAMAALDALIVFSKGRITEKQLLEYFTAEAE